MPPRTFEGVAALTTPVGQVAFIFGSRKSSRAVWEGRIASFPYCPMQYIRKRIGRDTRQQAAAQALLERRALVWTIDSRNTTARPKLPDRQIMRLDDGLKTALDVIAASILAEIDEAKIRDRALQAAGDRDIIPIGDSVSILEVDGIVGRLEEIKQSIPLGPFLPLLGYEQMTSLANPHLIEPYYDSFDESWCWDNSDADIVAIRPRYRAADELTVAAANAAGLPTTIREDAALPQLRLTADEIIPSPSIAQIFAHGLRLVDEAGTTVAPITIGLCLYQVDQQCALTSLHGAAPAPLDPDGRPVYFDVIWPILDDQDPITLARVDKTIHAVALYLSDTGNGLPGTGTWVYLDSASDWGDVDTNQLGRDLAERVASDFGDTALFQTRRRSEAEVLARDLRRLRYRITTLTCGDRAPKHLLGTAEKWQLDSNLIQRFITQAATLTETLDSISTNSLLGEAAQKPD